MSHGLDMVLRLRDDVVTEVNQRDKFQKNAPVPQTAITSPKVMSNELEHLCHCCRRPSMSPSRKEGQRR